MRYAALFLLFAATLAAQPKPVVLVVTAYADDYLLWAGGAIAGMIQNGARAHLVRVTGGENQESAQAAQLLGIADVTELGYRAGELAGVSPTELRDRLILLIRHYRPDVLFFPNPYSHFDDRLDRHHTGSAAEEARWAASMANFQPSHGEVALKVHHTAEAYYYAPPVDPARNQPETTATFAPQPKTVDIGATFDRKARALSALKTVNLALARDVHDRLARTGRRLRVLDTVDDASAARLLRIRLDGLPRSEEFLYAGPGFQIPSKLLP